MSASAQDHIGLNVLDMHIELRCMGMHKTLQVSIFFIEHSADIISVSFYSLISQLSFDTQHLILIHCKNGQEVENRSFKL